MSRLLRVCRVTGTKNVAGFSGDGFAATYAEFNFVYGLAGSSSGELFLADGGNRRIRMLDSSGSISTVAGECCPVYCHQLVLIECQATALLVPLGTDRWRCSAR